MSEGTATIGSCMAFAAVPPSTFDATGFAALTWVGSDEATNIGELGESHEVITFNTVCNGRVNKRLGATDSGQQSLELAYNSGNAAQGILKTASKNKVKVSVRETLATGDIMYYSAWISSFKTLTGTTADIIRASINFEIDSEIVEVEV